jgi:mannosyltransferase
MNSRLEPTYAASRQPGTLSPEANADRVTVSIEFDDIVYSLQRFGGISEYWREMTTRIEAMPGFAVVRRTGRFWRRMAVQRSNARVFHSSYYRTARGPKTRSVTTVHDLAYELGYVGNGAKALLHRREHRKAYFASDALICVSQSTRDDLLRVYPTLPGRCPIFVVPHGVTPRSVTAATPSVAAVDTPFVLFVGGRQAYKNFDTALAGFAASRLKEQGFVLACTGASLTSAEMKQVARLGLDPSVRSLGNVRRDELANLYATAHCLLYPSLFEGFGLPLLEAMQHGCPVVTSNRSVMPEVAGDAALLVNPLDPAAIAAALLDVCAPPTRQRLVAAGLTRAAEFSWDRAATQHASIYRSLI